MMKSRSTEIMAAMMCRASVDLLRKIVREPANSALTRELARRELEQRTWASENMRRLG